MTAAYSTKPTLLSRQSHLSSGNGNTITDCRYSSSSSGSYRAVVGCSLAYYAYKFPSWPCGCSPRSPITNNANPSLLSLSCDVLAVSYVFQYFSAHGARRWWWRLRLSWRSVARSLSPWSGKSTPQLYADDDCECLAGFCVGWLGGSAPKCKLRQHSFLLRKWPDERSVGLNLMCPLFLHPCTTICF